MTEPQSNPQFNPTPDSSPLIRLEQDYRDLQTDPDASLEAIDQAYFRLKTELIRQGKRATSVELKAAHQRFKAHWLQAKQQQAPCSDQPPAELDEMTIAMNQLLDLLRSHHLEAQARVHNSHLQIRIEPGCAIHPNRITTILYTLLEQDDLAILTQPPIAQATLYGMATPQKLAWKRPISLTALASANNPDNRDLMSFKNRHMNVFGWPVLLLLGMLMNGIPLVSFLLRGIKIWLHEFGHATIAWLAGRRAMPLPFGWTSVSLDRSLFVYLGLLCLFGLLFWAGNREKKRWPMVLAGILALMQFWFTWLLPESQFETLLAFGGIGGELYLCALLMASFYFPLPAYWRWDFYRYPVVLGTAFTFWGQFWQWHLISQGLEDIPWGSMWGEHGDMNNLSDAGWSDQQIISTYTHLSQVCLIALLSIYIYFGIQQNRHYLLALWQRWLARST